ncbi:MAG: hypothetical protein QOD47_105 [Gemmatimonadaceae bacterium]|jgi:hypothetical protein|nr:hypothetical protein [Gemmatimonadaceae bacterium]
MAVFLIGVAYLVALAINFAAHGLSAPIIDPILAVMEVLTLVSAPIILVVIAAIHGYASANHKLFALIALSFAIVFVGLTSAVHFVELTAIRQRGSSGILWPSPEYAVELLAWNLFLGLALLFAAPVFDGEGRERIVRRGLTISGALCVAGIVGPVVGIMRLQLVGVCGYAVVLPVVCFMLARLFRRNSDDVLATEPRR